MLKCITSPLISLGFVIVLLGRFQCYVCPSAFKSVVSQNETHCGCDPNQIKENNYYWRDYDGQIPADAITAGDSPSGETVYVGQAYTHKFGIFPVSVFEGELTVLIPLKNYTGGHRIKILCGPKNQFGWKIAKSDNVAKMVRARRDYKAVIGGHQDDFSEVYIGRARVYGGYYIGKINAYELDKEPLLWFRSLETSQGSESNCDSYELLVFYYTKNDNSKP